MKKLVKILAALTVAVAALAFVGCANATISPDGTVSSAPSGGSSGGNGGGATSVAAGTYNLTSMSDGTTTVTSADTDVWAAIPDSLKTLTVTSTGMTFMGIDLDFAETAMMEAMGVTFTTSGNTLTIVFDDGTTDPVTYVYTKA